MHKIIESNFRFEHDVYSLLHDLVSDIGLPELLALYIHHKGRQCFQDCLLRLHIRYSEGRQNPNIAPNSTQEVKEIQILSSMKFRW